MDNWEGSSLGLQFHYITLFVGAINQLKKTQLKQADQSHIKCQQTVIFKLEYLNSLFYPFIFFKG
jgi:hypothetical protein